MIFSGKRGVVATQFHWVFVLVAGALILMFFITIIGSIRNAERIKLGVEMMEKLDAVFTASSVNENTVHMIRTSGHVQFFSACDFDPVSRASYSSYGLRDPDVSVQNNRLAIFSPSVVSGDNFVVAVRAYSSPFRVDRMLFVSSPRIHFVLLGNDLNRLRPIFPANVTIVSFPSISHYLAAGGTGGDTQILITQEQVSLSTAQRDAFKDIAHKSTVLLKTIDPSRSTVRLEQFNMRSGRFSSSGNSEVVFTDNTTLLATLYAADGGNYLCGMEKLQRRFEGISYMYRLRYLDYGVSAPSRCGLHYTSAVQSLDVLTSLMSNEGLYVPGENPGSKVNQYVQISDEFRVAARNVEAQSCPILY